MGSGFYRIEYMRDVALTASVLFLAAGPVVAQTPGDANPPAERRESIIIGGKQSATSPFERCVEVEIGGENALGCLNQKLKREVDRVNPSINLPPLDARSSDVRVGNANEAAVRQQYGSNYGRSAYPFRPPAMNYQLPRH